MSAKCIATSVMLVLSLNQALADTITLNNVMDSNVFNGESLKSHKPFLSQVLAENEVEPLYCVDDPYAAVGGVSFYINSGVVPQGGCQKYSKHTKYNKHEDYKKGEDC